MIVNIILLIIVGLYVVFSLKVKEWLTISALGFRTETPENFIKNPLSYQLLAWILFLLPILIIYIFSKNFIATGIIVMFLLWLFSYYKGQKNGFKKYRLIIREMIEYEKVAKEFTILENLEEYEKELRLTDAELRKVIRKNRGLYF